MEKLIYLIGGDRGNQSVWRSDLVSALRAAGASDITLNIADLDDQVPSAAAERIVGPWQSLSAVLGFWLDCVDDRGDIEALLPELGRASHGYLVTESLVQPFSQSWSDGQRRPGVTQFTAHAKPESLSEEAFYRNWLADSRLSFDLHPGRWSYVRNAVARALTPGAPAYRAIVLEHFYELEDFIEPSRYFGRPEIVRQMYEELAGFCDVERMITGPMSEYHFA